MKNKKILLLLPSNNGTMAIRAIDLYYGLLKSGADVYVVIFNKSKKKGIKFENEFFFESRAIGIFRFFRKILWLRKLKRKICPEISIGVINACSTINILSGEKDYKIGVFRSPYEQSKNWTKARYVANRFSFQFLYPKLKKLYCVSGEVRNSIIKNFPNIENQKIEVVHNPFDVKRIQRLSNETVEYDFFFSHKVIIYVGHLHKNKGPHRLIKAFSLIDDGLKKTTKLVFIGHGFFPEYVKHLYDLVADLNLKDHVFFVGQKNNPYKYLRNATIFVLPSYGEGLPGSLIESLILKTPIVATNCSYGVWEALSLEMEYDKNLETNKLTHSGFITPNNAINDESVEENDIMKISEAIRFLLLNENMNFNFISSERFNDSKIIEKYFNPKN